MRSKNRDHTEIARNGGAVLARRAKRRNTSNMQVCAHGTRTTVGPHFVCLDISFLRHAILIELIGLVGLIGLLSAVFYRPQKALANESFCKAM